MSKVLLAHAILEVVARRTQAAPMVRKGTGVVRRRPRVIQTNRSLAAIALPENR